MNAFEQFSHGLFRPLLESRLRFDHRLDTVPHLLSEKGFRPRVVHRVAELHDVPEIGNGGGVGARQERLAVSCELYLAPVAELFLHGEA